jgi:hypothetical protein
MTNDQEEFAEEYSTSERIRIAAVGLALGALLVGAGNWWFFPWLREFAATAGCSSVFGVNGRTVLFYGVFAGLPLMAALIVLVTAGRRGFRILKERRMPPSGEKVFRPTRIQRGPQVRLAGWLNLLAAVLPLALAAWGVGQAQILARRAASCPAVTENKAVAVCSEVKLNHERCSVR